MVSYPETGSNSPIGSDRDRGRDTKLPKTMFNPRQWCQKLVKPKI